MKSLKSHLLLATPHLGDPNFARTVVLILKHDSDGAFGVVLNRPSDKTIKEIWEQLTGEPCESEQAVHVGGPVAGPLLAIHTQETASDIDVLPGLYVAMEKEKLERVLAEAEQPSKYFIGCAGWSGGQLEGEMEVGAWLTTPATAEYVLNVTEGLWRMVAGEISRSTLFPALGIKEIPEDPSLN